MDKTSTFCHLNEQGLLLVRGSEARKFLQGQVTCDINSIQCEDNHNGSYGIKSSLGAHCNHKGRVIFSFRVLPLDAQTMALVLPDNMQSIAIAALQKYIVFSRAELISASHDYHGLGVEGEQASAMIATFLGVDTLPEIPDAGLKHDKAIVLCVADNRYELWLTSDQASAFDAHCGSAVEVSHQYWDLQNMMAGIAQLHPSTSGRFTPHALNMHMTGTAVSFNKGCYTGQEVVARMQYLGELKRQLFLFNLPTTLVATEESLPCLLSPLYTPGSVSSIGEIVSIAQCEQTIHLLASVLVKQASQDRVFMDVECTQKLDVLIP